MSVLTESVCVVHLDLKASIRQETVIRRAAEVTDKSLMEFVLESAYAAAENALLDQRLFWLDEMSWKKFTEAIDKPSEVKPQLQKLMKDKSPWE